MLHHYSKSLLAVNIVLPLLAAIAVIFRFMARVVQKSKPRVDDYLILAALIVALGIGANGIYAAHSDVFGISWQKLNKDQFVLHGLLLWIDVFLCHTTYGFIKLSVVFFYKRIFVTPKFQTACNILLAVDLCWMIAAMFGHIFSAYPVQDWWLSYSLRIDYEAFLMAIAVIDATIDLVTVCYPLSVIKNLHMSRKRKISVAGVFMLGGFCIIASVIRLYYTWRLLLVNHRKISPLLSTAIQFQNELWADIEACFSIITACLPTLGPLVKGSQYFQTLKSSIKSKFSLFSRRATSSRAKHEAAETSSNLADMRRAWLELRPDQSKIFATANVATGNQDELSLIADGEGGIRLERSFESRSTHI